MGRVNLESIRRNCPLLTDEFEESQPLESFESSPKVVGIDKVSQVLLQLSVIVVMKAFDRSLLDSAVHSLDLDIGPRMLDFGEAMLNSILSTDLRKNVCKCVLVTGSVGELNAVIGQHGMNAIRTCLRSS